MRSVARMSASSERRIESWSRLATVGQLRLDRLDLRVGDLQVRAAAVGVEARLEQLDQRGGDVGMLDQRLLDVALAERRPGLAQVLRVRAQDVGLPPGQVGAHDQRVEPVLFDLAAPQQLERVDDVVGPLLVEVAAGWQPQAEVVDPDLVAAGQLELVGTLVEDLDAHLGEDRQRAGQRHRPAGAEHLQPAVGVVVGRRRVQREGQPVVVRQRIAGSARSSTATAGVEVLLVGLGERVRGTARAAARRRPRRGARRAGRAGRRSSGGSRWRPRPRPRRGRATPAGCPGRTAMRNCMRARPSSTMRSSRPMISPGQLRVITVADAAPRSPGRTGRPGSRPAR